MKTKGKITSWNDGKGYGFIAPMVAGERIFVHIKAFEDRSRRLGVGDVVTYSASVDAKGRPCAADVGIAGVKRSTKVAPSSWVYTLLVAVCFLLIVGGSVLLSAIPMPVLLIYFIISLATFVAYAFDKSAAKRGGWRTSENTLHLLSLVAGWPGALVAQSRLRHKSKKAVLPSRFLGHGDPELRGICVAFYAGGCKSMAVNCLLGCVRANHAVTIVRFGSLGCLALLGASYRGLYA